MNTPIKVRGKRLKAADVERLQAALVAYRILAIQCSNTAFNLAQTARDSAHNYDTTFQLIRDYDRSEGQLIEVLKDVGLYRTLAEASNS